MTHFTAGKQKLREKQSGHLPDSHQVHTNPLISILSTINQLNPFHVHQKGMQSSATACTEKSVHCQHAAEKGLHVMTCHVWKQRSLCRAPTHLLLNETCSSSVSKPQALCRLERSMFDSVSLRSDLSGTVEKMTNVICTDTTR